MTTLEPTEYYAAITDQTARLAAAVGDADQQLDVPTCPGWTLGKLAQHVGRAHRWTATIAEQQTTEPVDPRGLDDMRIPVGPEGRVGWLQAGAARLVEALAAAGPDTIVWTWTGLQPAMFWARRMAHETAVHGADAQLTVGQPCTMASELAADGISEWLTLLSSSHLASRFTEPPIADGQRMHLHATDDDGLGEAGEWLLRGTPSGMEWEPGHAKGDVAVRGPATSLLLVIMRRLPPSHSSVEVLGEVRVLGHWLEHTSF